MKPVRDRQAARPRPLPFSRRAGRAQPILAFPLAGIFDLSGLQRVVRQHRELVGERGVKFLV